MSPQAITFKILGRLIVSFIFRTKLKYIIKKENQKYNTEIIK